MLAEVERRATVTSMRHDTVIIGQAGLAMSYFLREQGCEHVIGAPPAALSGSKLGVALGHHK